MDQDNMASQEEELSDCEHCRRIFVEQPVEEAFFISSALRRKAKAEKLLDDFDQCQLTRGQLQRYLALADKLEDSVMRRAARFGHVVQATTACWLVHKPNLSDEDRDVLMQDERVAGMVAIVAGFEKALSGFVLASRDPKLREAHEALGVGRPDWEKNYDLSVEEWRENGIDAIEEDVDDAKQRRRRCQLLGKRD
ncbi:hypothetical protein CGRA01v4_08486 [Colletotrichum graminicola]|uniref:Uncharacterized protein n=1 Tax=Colletotrichum graminicola (strain M1.001 / M2 / FGSC 10212) TaxID=645133 RepID=E3QJM7_COLGM|nr:uncharacterized protein GLRG_06209 [Colletotrichum graminicola M1.001]EFQ31065.1 hypothetical protein GLRG_06209 [Colletotrichum graminicola M1.001]WDK17203.1 hypothetical protein CGRA01v4_08486 [Colletotrichum graminicola]